MIDRSYCEDTNKVLEIPPRRPHSISVGTGVYPRLASAGKLGRTLWEGLLRALKLNPDFLSARGRHQPRGRIMPLNCCNQRTKLNLCQTV